MQETSVNEQNEWAHMDLSEWKKNTKTKKYLKKMENEKSC